jgi:hypothetical protein
LNCELLSPAAVKAVVQYGASKSTHRVDEVVSGRTTPICRPDPADPVSPLSWDIVDAMSVVKESTLRFDGTPAAAELEAADEAGAAADDEAGAAAEDDDDDDDDEQPAAIRAVPAARATTPSPLLPSCIPYPFHRNAVCSYTTMRDSAQHACPHAMKGRSLGHGASSG